MRRLAVILSHPTQYYSPWFRYLAEFPDLTLKVFYLWDFGVTQQVDAKFGTVVRWDIPLLDGYDSEFVPNVSKTPGTHHMRGLDNPSLKSRIDAWKPDAVLMFGYAWKSMMRFIVTRKRSVPLLLRGDSHLLGKRAGGFASRLRKLVTRQLVRSCDHVLPVGLANADYYQSLGVPETRMTRVPHCVDNDRFREQGNREAGVAFRKQQGLPESARIVLFAGKFETKKRPLDLIRAYRQIAPADSILLMVGQGDLLEAARAEAGDSTSIRFLPFQNQSVMPHLYAAADLFVLPSFGNGETWGLAVNEAMNCGCGIVVSDHVGCAEDLVQPGINGQVFRAGSLEDLTEALRTSLADRNRLEQWKEASRSIIANYSYESARLGLMQALAKVCQTTGLG